ncbi:MAG TPA: hypothetical protein DGO89_09975 [Microcoleaceae bacterium UBA9251]|jgi:hypothetical protein|nr:hypothetical protein [Microcoleaceae cyanobacterium UBA9251]
MNSQFHNSASHSQVGIKSEQLDEIISAILSGKYSWACFLLLRCTGYNPLDYIPYRTSNRLLKENSQISKSSQSETKSALGKIADLDYLEVARDKRAGVRGGFAPEVKEGVDVQNQGFFAGFQTGLFNFAGE